MLKKILEFFILLIIWIALTWSYETPDIVAGIIISLIGVLLFSNLFPEEITKLLNPIRFFWFIIYIPIFLTYIIKSNLDVTYRVFHPEIPIKPGIVRVKTSLKSEIAKTFLANSITLTPGTLTVDCIDDILYVHWINIVSDDPEIETQIIVGKFEKYLKKIFE
jgi:multicomponent Na+:H+ antiporter subunit E